VYSLVFSDEFNVPGRNFANGHDSKWTALNIGDTSNKGSAFYLPEQATIAVDTNVSGEPVSALLIKTENKSHTGNGPTGETGIYMPYRSAMLQTWNKFCFTGGIVEFRARQPRRRLLARVVAFRQPGPCRLSGLKHRFVAVVVRRMRRGPRFAPDGSTAAHIGV